MIVSSCSALRNNLRSRPIWVDAGGVLITVAEDWRRTHTKTQRAAFICFQFWHLAIEDIDIPESKKGLRPLGNLLVSLPHSASLGIEPSDPPLSLVDPSRHVTIALLLSLFKI